MNSSKSQQHRPKQIKKNLHQTLNPVLVENGIRQTNKVVAARAKKRFKVTKCCFTKRFSRESVRVLNQADFGTFRTLSYFAVEFEFCEPLSIEAYVLVFW